MRGRSVAKLFNNIRRALARGALYIHEEEERKSSKLSSKNCAENVIKYVPATAAAAEEGSMSDELLDILNRTIRLIEGLLHRNLPVSS